MTPPTRDDAPATAAFDLDAACLRALREELDDLAISLLGSDGQVMTWNPGAARITGHRAEDVVGAPIASVFPNHAEPGRLRIDLELAAAKGRVQMEGWTLRKDGLRFWASVTLNTLRDDAGEPHGFKLWMRDVSDRKRADQLGLMAELALNAMIMVGAEGRMIAVNAQAEKLFGYSRDQLIGQSVELLVPERFRARHPGYRSAFFDAPVVRPMGAGRDLYGQRKDGSEFPVEIGLNPIETDEGRLVLASIVDITERKRADEKFRLAVESAPNAMVMVNEQGQIILANLQAEKLFGYSRAELESLPIESLVPDRFRASHPAYRQSYSARPVARAMGSGRDLFARRKDGTEFPVEIGLNPIQTAEGLHILGAIVDITQRKQLERQAREQLVELAHVSRLTTVGEMFSGLAHEINQPLGAAANYARACVRFAKSGAATPEELIEYMEKAAIENGRACEIVNRMRAFVRKDFSPPAPVDINEIVEYVVTLLDAGMRTGVNAQAPVTPRLELTTPLPRVSAVRVQIEQVLVNLARNAVEAMAESSSPSRELSIRSWRDQDFVCVAVADTGPGVAPEQLTNLFKPFFSTKHHGMGLGLSISRSIAEAHQGRLDVESTLGEGTTFCLKLPIARVEETP